MRRTRGKNYLRERPRNSKSENSFIFEKTQERINTIRTLHNGKIVKGEVFNILDCGALVNISGVVGFIHISDISEQHVKFADEYLKIGEFYDFKIIEIGLNKRGELSTKLTRKFVNQAEVNVKISDFVTKNEESKNSQ